MKPLYVALLPGLVDYPAGLSLQNRLLQLRQQNQVGDILLLLEHPPVLTLGKHADDSNILFAPAVLEAQGIKVYQTDRGGNVTYHGPGQIVGYPIMNLKENGLGVRRYIELLEQVFIDLLAEEYGLTAYRDPQYPGVWIGNEKITAIGCAVKKWVTMHGFALNVNTNLDHFKVINPCGIMDRGVASLQSLLGEPVDLEFVKQLIIKHFCRCFGKEAELISEQELQKLMGDGSVVD